MPKALRIGIMGAVVFFALVMAVSNGTDKQPTNAPAQAVQAAATASPKALDGRMTIQPGDWIGYRDRDTLERATKLATQGDKAAYTQLMGNGIARGICTMFKPGEEVFLEENALLAGLVKIRRKGEISGWWTNFEAVK
ncbi:MAG: hypothetical protein KKF77_02920 [Proteobacteria bacterium]|nr:hypothetical protein [Pseudomonadota bacterium]